MPKFIESILTTLGLKTAAPPSPASVEAVLAPLRKLLDDLNTLEKSKLIEAKSALISVESYKLRAEAARAEADRASVVFGKLSAVIS